MPGGLQLALQPLLTALGWLLEKLTLGFLIYRSGKRSVARKAEENAIAAKDIQLREAIDAPKTRDELVQRVRKSGL